MTEMKWRKPSKQWLKKYQLASGCSDIRLKLKNDEVTYVVSVMALSEMSISNNGLMACMACIFSS